MQDVGAAFITWLGDSEYRWVLGALPRERILGLVGAASAPAIPGVQRVGDRGGRPVYTLHTLSIVKAGCPCLEGLALYDAHFGSLTGAARVLAQVSAIYDVQGQPYPPDVMLSLEWETPDDAHGNGGRLLSKLVTVKLGERNDNLPGGPNLWYHQGVGFLALLEDTVEGVLQAVDHDGPLYADHLTDWLAFMAKSREDWQTRNDVIRQILHHVSRDKGAPVYATGFEEHRDRALMENTPGVPRPTRTRLDLTPLEKLRALLAPLVPAEASQDADEDEEDEGDEDEQRSGAPSAPRPPFGGPKLDMAILMAELAEPAARWKRERSEASALAVVHRAYNVARTLDPVLHAPVTALTFSTGGIVPTVEAAIEARNLRLAHHTIAVAVRDATDRTLLYVPNVVQRVGAAVEAMLQSKPAKAPAAVHRRVDGAAIAGVLNEFLAWVDAQPDAHSLRAVLPTVQGEVEGWIGDALLWSLMEQHAKVYKVKRPLTLGDAIGHSAFILGTSFVDSGALEVGPGGDLIRVPALGDAGETRLDVLMPKGAIPSEVRGVPGHKVSDLLHERVDLSALSGPTRAYLRAYLREFIEDDDAGDEPDREARLSVIDVALEGLPLTAGGLAGLEDLRQRAMSILASDWMGHPIAARIAHKRALIETALRPAEAVLPGDVEPTMGKVPKWASRLVAAAQSSAIAERLAHHGQGALRFASALPTRDLKVALTWQGGGRSLTVTVDNTGATTYSAVGTFTSETGEQVAQPRWTIRVEREAAGLLPDAWLDKLRTVAPPQTALLRFDALDLTDAQRNEVGVLLQHTLKLELPVPTMRYDEHKRVFLTTTIEGHASTVGVPPSGQGFPWASLGVPPGRLVALPEALWRHPGQGVSEPLPRGKRAAAKVPSVTPGPAPTTPQATIAPFTIPDHSDVDNIGWQRHIDAKKWERAEREVYRALRDKGYRLESQLGCGMYGCAYLGRPYVIKITGDPLEVANAQVVATSGADLEGVVRIYAVFAFSDAPKLYAVITEVLEAPAKNVKAWVDKHRVDWWRRELERGALTHAQYTKLWENARQSAPAGTDVEAYLTAIDALYAMGVFYQEGHSENVMVRREGDQKVLVAIDLGYSATPGAEIPVLA